MEKPHRSEQPGAEHSATPETPLAPAKYEKTDLYKVFYPVFRSVLNFQYDRTVIGAEHIPDQPTLFIPNHIRIEDSPLVAASYTEVTGKPLRFAAKREYFDGKGINDHGKLGRSVRFFMEHTEMIPVDREAKSPRAFQELQHDVLDRIAHGDSVALHAEGTRSDDGRLHKFKSGASRIALAGDVAIAPVGLVYTDYSNGRKKHVDVIFGEPIMPEAYHHLPYTVMPNRLKADHLIQEIEDRVAGLTGMPQSGAFASLRKLRHPHHDNDGQGSSFERPPED